MNIDLFYQNRNNNAIEKDGVIYCIKRWCKLFHTIFDFYLFFFFLTTTAVVPNAIPHTAKATITEGIFTLSVSGISTSVI